MTIYDDEIQSRLPLLCRTEIEVLPADDPKQIKLGFVIREYNGTTVYLAADETESPIQTMDGIQIGDHIMVVTLIGTFHMIVLELKGDTGYACTTEPNNRFYAHLEFGKDERQCWTSDYGSRSKIIL